MFLERLNIRGFGCLRTTVTFATDRVNLAVADNETGKSTLIASILAAFYGIVEDLRDRRDKRPHRRHVIPWENPEEFGIELDFTNESRRWRIERDFNSGEVHLIDRDTGRDHAADYHRGRGTYMIGEELIGLPVDEFLKSFYLKQEEILEIRESKGLTHYIQGVATALEGGTSSELAIQRLRDTRDRYPFEGSRDGLKIENAIKRLQTDRESCLVEIEKLERARNDMEPEAERLKQIEAEIERLRTERETAIRQGDIADIRELRHLIDAQKKKREEIESLAKTAEELKTYESFPANKWEQLLSSSQRVNDLTASASKLETRLKEEVEVPLTKLETELQSQRDLAGITEAEARDLESGVNRLNDRRERLDQAERVKEKLEQELKAVGLDKDRFSRLQQIFSGVTTDERRFIEHFRAAYAEEEALYRELKTRREWNERERGLIVGRQNKIINTARLFFLMAAVMVFSGGTLILLTQGEWLGQVLAGLGVVFGAIGAITRGMAGGGDTGALKKLEVDLAEVIKGEDESHAKVEKIGRDLTEIASRLGFEGGHELLAEYFQFDDMKEKVEPLIIASKEADRTNEEFKASLDQLAPFFSRAGDNLPPEGKAVDEAKTLLNRYREVVKLSGEFKAAKIKRDEIDAELTRVKRDRDPNRQTCEDILRQAGIDKIDPLDEAVEKFKAGLENHKRYADVAVEKLPRLRKELLPEVDLAAKNERLAQLVAKTSLGDTVPELEHQKEYYRDLAEQKGREEEKIRHSREAINRQIGVTYERYQSQYPDLRRRVEDLDEKVSQAEAFRAEIDMAVQIMNDISREVYRSWAAALSEEAAPFLEALNPRYCDLQFHEDLTFVVRDKGANKLLTSAEAEAVLSSGARDEIFLAARLGIACYLARGAKGAMPIVLDEPLAAVDDEKFVSGMRFFLQQLSTRHQLLIMSCHEERHRWLAGRIPVIFDEKVHKLVLR